jgi:hypothetical protein
MLTAFTRSWSSADDRGNLFVDVRASVVDREEPFAGQ